MTTATQTKPADAAPPAGAGLPTNDAKKTPPAPAPQLRELALDCIEPSRLNPRKEFAKDALQELAESIKTSGVLQPIVVRRNEPGQQYFEIVMGERRYRAAKAAGLKTIPAVVHEALPDVEAAKMAMVENLQRQDMNAVEEAEGYAQLLRLMGETSGKKITHDQLAEEVGKKRPTVTNALRLLELPQDVLETIRDGKLTPAHGLALLKFKQWPKIVQCIAKHTLSAKMAAGDLEGELDYEIKDVVTEAGLWFDCCSMDAAGPDWSKLQKEFPARFFIQKCKYGDEDQFCTDVTWGEQQIAEAKVIAEARLQKKLAAAKNTPDTGPVNLDKLEWSEQKKWAELLKLPPAVQKLVDRRIVRPGTHYGKKADLIPAGVARSLTAKFNREARERLVNLGPSIFKQIMDGWKTTLPTATGYSVACTVDSHSAALLAFALTYRPSEGHFTMDIGALAQSSGVVLPKNFEREWGCQAFDHELEALRRLESLGTAACLRLALGCVLNDYWGEALEEEGLDTLPAQIAFYTEAYTPPKTDPAKVKSAKAKTPRATKPAKKGAKK